MAIEINRITNANVYLDGASLLGKAEEIKLPDITAKMVEHKALGLAGTIELPSGFDKMEGEVKWSSYYADVMAKAANPFKFVSIQVRCNVETYSTQGRTEEKPLVTFLTVAFKKNPGGTFKQHDNAEFPTSFSVYYIKQVLDGQDILEFDAMSNIYKVNGEDMLANYRANVE
ncbi:MAG: phage tail core [Gallionellaceae bacterium]|nr:MAG: phage tail core [Gallionellaceae bacterium]